MNVKEATAIATSPSGTHTFSELVEARRTLHSSGMKNIAKGLSGRLEAYLQTIESTPTHKIPLEHLVEVRNFAEEMMMFGTAVTLTSRIRVDPRFRKQRESVA